MNDNDILIVCALRIETQGQLDNYHTLYTGVGKVNATYELVKYLSTHIAKARPKLIINYGTAGSRKIKKKTLVDCTKFVQRDMDVTGLGFMRGETPFEDNIPLMLDFGITEYNTIGRRATCGSGDSFVEDRTQYYGEVVDMEAYALAKVCYKEKIPFVSFKYITDGADEQAHEDWEANLVAGIGEFKDIVLSEIK
jgi:adenosylhomocysteine nucleosidase